MAVAVRNRCGKPGSGESRRAAAEKHGERNKYDKLQKKRAERGQRKMRKIKEGIRIKHWQNGKDVLSAWRLPFSLALFVAACDVGTRSSCG